MAASGAKMRDEAQPLPVCTLLVIAVAVSLGLQGCGDADPDEDKPISRVLEPSELATNGSKAAGINFNRVSRDCTAKYLEKKLKRSTAEFRKVARERLKVLEDIPEQTREQHIDYVFPEDAAEYFINDKDTGFLRKDEVYCNIRRHLSDMDGKMQLNSMVEEVQSRVSHIIQFLPENAYGFRDAQSNDERMKAMKGHYKLTDLSTELFIKLREVMIPLKEEQMKTALYAVSAFATGGCLQFYFEDQHKDKPCKNLLDNSPIYLEEENTTQALEEQKEGTPQEK